MTARRRLAVLAALVLLPAAMGGCTTVAATGQREFIVLSWDQEIELGREAAPELEQEFGGPLDDLAVQAYVRTVGQRVAASSHHPDLPYTFTALDSDVINAFALPGGAVYITRGLLKEMTSEGELAAVLGHEVAHVNARHSSQQISRQMGLQMVITAAAIAAGGGEGGLSGSQAETLAKVVGSLISLKYSRGAESEADRIGLDYMAAAGYHPDEMIDLLTVFVEMEGRGRPPEFLSTHPNPNNRVGVIRQRIAEKYPDRGGRVAEQEYQRQVLGRL